MNDNAEVDYTQVYKRIIELLYQQNKSFSDLKALGVNPQVLTRLSSGSAPSADKLYKIAKYLDTTCEFLLTGEDSNSNINNSSEEKFMFFFRHLPADYKLPIKMLTESMYETAKKTNRLVENELDDIFQQLLFLRSQKEKKISELSKEDKLKDINEEWNNNQLFEQYIRLNYGLITDRKRKDTFELNNLLDMLNKKTPPEF